MSIIAGSTPKFLVRIKDEDGVQVDPGDANEVIDVKISVYNALTGVVIAKFYLNTLPSEDGEWRKVTTKDLGSGDVRIVLPFTAEETLNAPSNQNEIKISVTVPDDDMTDGERIEVNIGRFPDIKHTKDETNG